MTMSLSQMAKQVEGAGNRRTSSGEMVRKMRGLRYKRPWRHKSLRRCLWSYKSFMSCGNTPEEEGATWVKPSRKSARTWRTPPRWEGALGMVSPLGLYSKCPR